ncbi:MAG: hypothetical protein AAGD35_21695 [Actinomycetota bacterium]
MFTWGSKYLFGIAALTFIGAVLYGLISGGGLIGVVSAGYKGGVGDHTGYTIRIALGLATLFLGVITVITRDGDARAASDAIGVDRVLSVATPRASSFWAPLAAFGVACIAVGLAVGQAFVILGIVILAVVLLEWTILAWSDRATGDEGVNNVIRNRIIGPLEVPMLSMLGIAVVVIGMSRVMLTVSKAGATIFASIAATIIFATCIALAKSKVSRSVITGLVAVGAFFVLGGGIVGAVRGEREIVHHGEHSDHGESHSEGGEGEGE